MDSPPSVVPAVVAFIRRVLQHAGQLAFGKFLKIVAPKQITRLAQKFASPQCPATQCIKGWRPCSLCAVDSTLNISLQDRAACFWQASHADPAKTYARRSVTPLTGPRFPTFDAQIRPIATLRAEAGVLKVNALLRGSSKVFTPACGRQRSERICKSGRAMGHSVERA